MVNEGKAKSIMHIIDNVKNIVWVCMGIFTVSAFIQTLLTLSPRLTKVEERIGLCESKVSGIEIKLDAILIQNKELMGDMKNVYHLILDKHSK